MEFLTILSKGKVIDVVLVVLAALLMAAQNVREMDRLPEVDGKIE